MIVDKELEVTIIEKIKYDRYKFILEENLKNIIEIVKKMSSRIKNLPLEDLIELNIQIVKERYKNYENLIESSNSLERYLKTNQLVSDENDFLSLSGGIVGSD